MEQDLYIVDVKQDVIDNMGVLSIHKLAQMASDRDITCYSNVYKWLNGEGSMQVDRAIAIAGLVGVRYGQVE